MSRALDVMFDAIERTAITAGAVGIVAAVLVVTYTPLGDLWASRSR